MSKRSRAVWRIEIQQRFEVLYRRDVRGDLTEVEVTSIIQRLACRNLSEDEIVSASLRKPAKTSLLEPIVGLPSQGRHVVWIDHGLVYVATRWRAGEQLPD